MAGDWIMVDHELPDKPEVIGIFERTGVEIATIVGRLQLLWCHADKMTIDGNLAGMGIRSLCAKFGGDTAFWQAVADVKWLTFTPTGCQVPNFIDRFGQSAKARKMDARRKQMERVSGRWTTTGHDADEERTHIGQQSDQKNTPEPRTENREPRNKNRLPAGAFSKLSVQSLKDTVAIVALAQSEADQLRYLGAAERAIEVGKRPVALFVRIVTSGDWHLISAEQEERARQRLRLYLHNTGPPPSNSPSESLAANLQTLD